MNVWKEKVIVSHLRSGLISYALLKPTLTPPPPLPSPAPYMHCVVDLHCHGYACISRLFWPDIETVVVCVCVGVWGEGGVCVCVCILHAQPRERAAPFSMVYTIQPSSRAAGIGCHPQINTNSAEPVCKSDFGIVEPKS